jgi:hypothetical protein
MPLTNTAIRDAKTLGKPYKLTDGKGLYVLVTPTVKYWRFRYRFRRKENTLSFGVYPDVNLKDARQRRDDARELLAEGTDPAAVRREEKSRDAYERLAAKNSSKVQVSVAIDGAVEIWKGRAVIRLTKDEGRSVNDLLTKLST